MSYPHSTVTQDEYDALKVTLAMREAQIRHMSEELRKTYAKLNRLNKANQQVMAILKDSAK
jgi:hypothetical protein